MLRLQSPSCTGRASNSHDQLGAVCDGCAHTCMVVPLRGERVHHLLAVHRAIIVAGVERFGDPARANLDQLAAREALCRALPEAFAASGIGWG